MDNQIKTAIQAQVDLALTIQKLLKLGTYRYEDMPELLVAGQMVECVLNAYTKEKVINEEK